jgi:DNA-binding response OmpR family regulator
MNIGTYMREDQLRGSDDATVIDLATLQHLAVRQIWPTDDDQTERPTSYRLALRQETVQLGIVEFRILLYLAGRPYHAFTRRSIADAVSSKRDPVGENMVDQHIASLLNQLGVFHDYVQSVPYIGYRFKA